MSCSWCRNILGVILDFLGRASWLATTFASMYCARPPGRQGSEAQSESQPQRVAQASLREGLRQEKGGMAEIRQPASVDARHVCQASSMHAVLRAVLLTLWNISVACFILLSE